MRDDELDRLARASVRYYDCLCEFSHVPGAEDACAGLEDAWDDAVVAYKRQGERPAPAPLDRAAVFDLARAWATAAYETGEASASADYAAATEAQQRQTVARADLVALLGVGPGDAEGKR